MVPIQTVRAHNARLKELGPGLVAVFVGGTAGIGETTAREFVRNTLEPRVYLVGRNEAAASRLISEFQGINAGGKVTFVKGDVSLLRGVDAACDDIKTKEDRINLLFMTQGVATLKGRDETSEGLDKKFSLHYYSRMRFVQNLLPQLTRAAAAETSDSPQLSRVVSVFAAGTEGKLIIDDLSLKQHYSLKNCASHAVTMNSLAVEELAAANPRTTFIHAYPGLVKTSLGQGVGPLTRAAVGALGFLVTPWTVPLTESGERHLYAATSPTFPPASSSSSSTAEQKENAALGSAGVKGSGAYLLSWDGTPVGKEKILTPYRTQGMGQVVWNHTMDVFNKVCEPNGPGKY